MTQKLSEATIVGTLADHAARSVTRKAVAALQKRTETTSGCDSGLKTVWDEIFVQVQYEESVLWDAYDETVRAFLEAYVKELAQHEREAIWLQTDAGRDWDCEEPEQRESYPVLDDDIVDYLVRQLYPEAGRWSNARIRAFIDRASMRD